MTRKDIINFLIFLSCSIALILFNGYLFVGTVKKHIQKVLCINDTCVLLGLSIAAPDS